MVGVALIVAFMSAVEVDMGHIGVIMNWGGDQPKALEPGLHFITPFKQSIEAMNMQLQTYEVSASAASKDLQTVTTKISAIEREAKALRDNPNLIQLRAIGRWSGTLPNYSGGGQPIPFINVTSASGGE